MGYSCTQTAYQTLERYFSGDDSMANTWRHNGQRYFYERGRENDDGAITGTVYQWRESDNLARKVGSFRIEPDGRATRAPFGMLAKTAKPASAPWRAVL
jgi:hypothetical protein